MFRAFETSFWRLYHTRFLVDPGSHCNCLMTVKAQLCRCKQFVIEVGSGFLLRSDDTRQDCGGRKYDGKLGDLSIWQPPFRSPCRVAIAGLTLALAH